MFYEPCASKMLRERLSVNTHILGDAVNALATPVPFFD